ncbi:MAG TPA: TonB-dependent receptor, partial [Bryobacteraceae bacterium]|nr:TonB-dependent receptor [Bryobacteraceae bacterium]
AFAQSTATLQGEVADVTGAPVANATVLVSNALTGFSRELKTEADGRWIVTNLPFNTYVVLVSAPGFAAAVNEVPLRSNIPRTLAVKLAPAPQTAKVEVTAFETSSLIEPEATGTRTELNARAIEHMPLPPNSRGVESVLLSLPGFAANANGAIHPRGAHNQMSYVIDGMPITDQLTGSFANAVDPSIVQTIELYTGNVPAEYGNKISGVASITTKSGMGGNRPFSGNTQVNADTFDTLGQVTQLAGGTERFGYFASINTLKSNRYLDQVSTDNLHNGGNSQRAFSRFDWQLGGTDQLRLNLLAGRSGFELANLRSQNAAGQDQRQLLRDFAASIGWLHTLDPLTTVDTTLSYRTAIAQLSGSPGDTPVTAAQARHLTTVTLAMRGNRHQGAHTIRAGADWQHFPVSENFSFGITHPEFNAPSSDNYIPTLAAHDVSRGGALFHYSGRRSGKLYSAFAQDNVKLGRLMLSLGLRYDAYRFLATAYQLQPRIGAAFHIRETGTVLRASYNRTFQTPPNENLLLSSSQEAAVLVSPLVREALGAGVVIIRPERQNVYEVGLQQALGRKLSLNASFYHKDSRDLQDNDNFFNTGIIFPTSLSRSRTNGAEARVMLLPVRRLSGSVSLTHYHTVVTPPFTGGLFLGSTALDLLTAGPFIIDHDQKLGVHTILEYKLRKNIWLSGAVRYDSGLVSNPSDAAEVAADADYFDLLPYVNLASDPPRVRPRTIADLAIGYERMRADRRLWDAVFQVSNLAGSTALYNFQSIFVGTRLVQPRTFAVKLRYYF